MGNLKAFASSDSLVAAAASPLARKLATNGSSGTQQDCGDEEAAALLSRGASASAEAPAGPDHCQGGSGLLQSPLSLAVVTAYRTASSAVTSWLSESRAVLLGRELGGRALPALHTQVGPHPDLDADPCAAHTGRCNALCARCQASFCMSRYPVHPEWSQSNAALMHTRRRCP